MRGLLTRRWELLPRAGLGLAALAGVIAALSSGLRGAEQLDGLATVDISVVRLVTLGVLAAVILGGLAVAPWSLARVLGAGAAALFGVLFLLIVVGLRTADDLVRGVDVTLAPGGWLLVLAGLVAFAGLGLVIVSGFVVVEDLPGGVGRWPLDKVALSLAVAGIVIPPLAACGVALGQHAPITGPRRQPLALAAVIGGILVVACWAVALLLGALTSDP